jgi:hypothetical protein
VARIAAFTAPALPIASTPTGIPPGIWTIDSSESSPPETFVSIGTPSTGSMVWAATTPGSAAAIPAPATMTSIPRRSAARTHPASSSGVRCADSTRVSQATPSASSCATQCRIVSQSEREPITTPTSGSPTECTSGSIVPSPAGGGGPEV